mgnify:CR=1 FL=1
MQGDITMRRPPFTVRPLALSVTLALASPIAMATDATTGYEDIIDLLSVSPTADDPNAITWKDQLNDYIVLFLKYLCYCAVKGDLYERIYSITNRVWNARKCGF